MRVVAPAGPVDGAKLQVGVRALSARGFEPGLADNVTSRLGYFAGSDAERLRELQEALDDPCVGAVWAARGGFGTMRLIDRLRFDGLHRDPKWIVGSSDLTALLLELWVKHGIASIHGPMVAGLSGGNAADLDAVCAVLRGVRLEPPAELTSLCDGAARGPLIGGNLSIVASCLGALPDSFADGAILFLEDVGERPYRIDRYLVQLDRAGVLARAAGVLLGDFTACDPGPDGTTVDQVLEERFSHASIPVAKGYPAAHGARNAPFVHGGLVELEVRRNGAALRFAPLE